MLALLNRWNEQIAKHPRLASGVLFAVTVLIFQGVLAGTFVFDDAPLILENPYVTKAVHWKLFFSGSIWSFSGNRPSYFYRPLQFLVYSILYRFAGPNPVVFHAVQLCVYAGAVCLVFCLGRRLLRHDLAAFAGALLWALHPLHVEPVAWIADLGDAAAGMTTIASFLLFLRAEESATRRLARHALAAAVYFLALLFKELALCFPLLIVTYGFFIGGKDSWLSRASRWLPYALATIFYAAMRVSALGRFSAAPHAWKIDLNTIAAALGLLGQHAKFFAWPVRLSLARDFDPLASLRSPWPWLTLLVLLAILVFARREALLSFLVAWWGVALLPCLDIRQLVGSDSAADRYSYLPSVGLCLAIAFSALVLLPRHVPRTRPARLLLPALSLLPALWAVQDVRNIPNWRSNAALWSHAAAAMPDSAVAHLFHAISLEYELGDLDAAEREYRSALRLNQTSFRPTQGMVYESDLGLGRVALMKGRTQEAVSYFETAVHVAPVLSPAYRALGALYFPQGKYARAAEYFEKVLKITPDDLEARFFLGTCWLKLGKPQEAAAQFHAARVADPSYWQAYDAEARALEAAGDPAGAARVRNLRPKH